jgi:hypothetical protein
MKTALIDLTTMGIIFVHSSPNLSKIKWEMSMMRSCVLDTNVFRIPPSAPLYSQITNETVQEQFYVTGRGYKVDLGNADLKNRYFTEKQTTAQLIYPLVKALTDNLYTRSIAYIEDHALPMDDTIAVAILESDPATHSYSAGVLEYASTLEITPQQAYQELKIDYETVHGIKMRVYAVSKKYASLIRSVSNKEQADALLQQINQQLYLETFL